MTFRDALIPIAILCFCVNTESSTAAENDADKSPETSAKVADAPDLTITEHSAKIDGEKLSYTVTAGTLPQRSEDDEEKITAQVFFTSYVREQEGDGPRPLTFCFNGGPGSSSVWLHLGMLGPVRVHLNSDAEPVRPPARLKPNPFSLLDRTDLVFIDPVSTGYSRPAKKDDADDFHGFQEDLNSVGRFIHDYLTHFERWDSPLFLCGESYGTLRAAGLSGHLRGRYRIELNGIILVSTVLDFRTIAFDSGNDLPYVLFLPGYAATAWYHDQLEDELQQTKLPSFLKDVEQFAEGPYAEALLRGRDFPKVRKREVIKTMSRYTGLDAKYIQQADLRIPMWRFAKELLRDDGRVIGRFDSRYAGRELDLTGDSMTYDPSAAALFGPFTSAMNSYLRKRLNITKDVPYEILTGKVRPWNYDSFENRYVSVTDTLTAAMTENPFLKVFVASGHYDLATPYKAAHYTFSHLPLASELQKNITLRDYPAGHMMYVHEPSLKKLRHDLRKFYDEAADPTDER